MTSTPLKNGHVLHLPAMPFVFDQSSLIIPPSDDELAEAVPLIPADGLLLFAGRLVSGARKRRHDPRWQAVNDARLRLALRCIQRALAENAENLGINRFQAID